MKTLFDRFKLRTDFSRNVFAIMTGTGIAQIIAVVATPILSRIYSPADWGVFSLYQSIVIVIAIIISARYEQTIVLPKEDKDAVNLTALSLWIVLAISLLLWIPVLGFRQAAASLLKNENIFPWLIWIPVSALLVGLSQTLNNYFIRKKDFRHTGKSPMIQSMTKAAVNISMGLGKNMQGGLIWGYLAGQLAAVIVLLSGRIKLLAGDLSQYFEWSYCLAMAKKYKNYALTLVPANLVGSLAGNMPVFLLSGFFSNSIVGFYGLSYSVVNLPVTVVGKALADVSYKHTMEIIHSDKSLAEYMERVTAHLLLIAVIPLLILLFFSPFLFSFFFDAEWRTSGIYVQILLPVFLLRFLSSPVTVFSQKNKSYLLLYWQIMFLLFTVGSLLLGGMAFKSDVAAIALLSASSTFCYFVLLMLNFKIAGAKFKNVWINMKNLLKTIK
jgi:O-antigen/teichoic acid export membrane protein